VKASAFRRWPVTAPYRGEQTTRLTGGHDFMLFYGEIILDGLYIVPILKNLSTKLKNNGT